MLRYRSVVKTKTVVNEMPQTTVVIEETYAADVHELFFNERSLIKYTENDELQSPPTARSHMEMTIMRKTVSFFF